MKINNYLYSQVVPDLQLLDPVFPFPDFTPDGRLKSTKGCRLTITDTMGNEGTVDIYN